MSNRFNLKNVARLLLPPLIFRYVDRLGFQEWEYLGPQWPTHRGEFSGWDDPSVGQVMREQWETFTRRVAGTEPLAFWPWSAGVRSRIAHNVIMTFGYVLARTVRGGDRLSVLDWGGALGHYALLGKALLPEVTLDYTVKERPDVCAVGRELLPDVIFTASDDECFSRQYDLAMASGALQYAEDWRSVAGALARSARRRLFIANLPVVHKVPSFAVVQRPQRYGLKANSVSWVIKRGDFLDQMKEFGLTLEREFLAWDRTHHHNAPEDPETISFLFRLDRVDA